MVENLLQSIINDREEGFEYDFCIENPRALLRFRPYMIADTWMGVSSRCTAPRLPKADRSVAQF